LLKKGTKKSYQVGVVAWLKKNLGVNHPPLEGQSKSKAILRRGQNNILKLKSLIKKKTTKYWGFDYYF
jgi:hypothetical protein